MKNHHVHTLNTSSGKQKYSFSKASRFDPYKAKTDVSYLPEVSNDRRSAIIGHGKRSLMEDKTHNYYPHAYQIPSLIDNKHGNSFKAGRHDLGGPMQMLKYNKSIPGPSSYSIPTTLANKGASMKPRLADTSLKYLKDVPGPGAYSVPSSISNGQQRIYDSKYSYSGSTKIPPKSSKSLDLRTPLYQKPTVPGPGQYDVQKYGIGNPQAPPFRNEGGGKFGKQLRQSLADKNAAKVPGPGQYKIYSEFDD